MIQGGAFCFSDFEDLLYGGTTVQQFLVGALAWFLDAFLHTISYSFLLNVVLLLEDPY